MVSNLATEIGKAQLSKLGLLLLVSILVRVPTMSWHAVGDDEAQGLAIASLPLGQMLHALQLDGNAPLWYLVLRAWVGIFGQSDFALKSLALLVSCLVPVVAYVVFDKMLNSAIAIRAAVLLCFCSAAVGYSNLARPYALLTLLALASIVLLFQLMRKPSLGTSGVYAACLTLMIYTHCYGLAIILGETLAIVIGVIRKWCIKETLLFFALAGVVSLLLFLPWLMNGETHAAFEHCKLLWNYHFSPAFIILVPQFLYLDCSNDGFNLARILVSLLICTASIAIPPPGAWPAQEKAALRIAQIILGGGIAAMVVFVHLLPHFHPRYVLPLIPLAMLLLVALYARVGASAFTLPKTIMLGICLSLAWLPDLCRDAATPLNGVSSIAEHIQRNLNTSRDTVVCSYEPYAVELDRLLPNDANIVSFPALSRIQRLDWSDLDLRIRDARNYSKLETLMSDTFRNGGAVWFIQTLGSTDSAATIPTVEEIKPELDHSTAQRMASVIIRGWLEEHARAVEHFTQPALEYSAESFRFVGRQPEAAKDHARSMPHQIR